MVNELSRNVVKYALVAQQHFLSTLNEIGVWLVTKWRRARREVRHPACVRVIVSTPVVTADRARAILVSESPLPAVSARFPSSRRNNGQSKRV